MNSLSRSGRRAATFRRIFLRPVAILSVLSFFPPDAKILNLIPTAQAAPAPVLRSLPSNCTQLGEEALIQKVCNPTINLPPGADLIAAIKQFEFDTVNQFLAFYSIPVNENNHDFVYLYGRMGLRNTLRAFIEARMMNVILEKPSLRTANEQTVLTWLQQTVGQREKIMYDSALADQQNWAHNTCGYQIDQDIAKEFNINYIPCVGAVVANNAPTASYFLASAFKKAYVQPLNALNPTAINGTVQQNPPVAAVRQAGVSADLRAAETPVADVDRAELQPRDTSAQINLVSFSSVPDLVGVGVNFTVVVKLLDFNFQPVSSNVAVTLSSAPSGIGGTLTVNASNGVATFNNLVFNTQGAYNVTAKASNVSSSVHIVNAGTSCGGCSTSGFTVFQGINSNLQAILGTAGAIVGAGALFATLTAAIKPLRLAIFPTERGFNTLKKKTQARQNCGEARTGPSPNRLGVFRGVQPRGVQPGGAQPSVVQPRALAPREAGSCSLDEEEDSEDSLDELASEEDLTDAAAAESGDAALVPEVGADAAAIASTEIAETGGSEAAAAVAGVGVGLASTGIGIVLGAAVLLVDTAVTFTVLEANAVTEEYNQLLALSQNADNNLPDMAAMIQDQTGAYKIQEIWTEAMWPDAPASSVIPSPGAGEPVMVTQNGIQTSWNQVNSLHYKDWAGITWNAETYQQWWVQTGSSPMPSAITSYTGVSTPLSFDGVTPIIRYLDWSGNRMQAARNGTNFQISKQNPMSTDVPCPADLTAGVTLGDLSTCSSWVASSFQLLDNNLQSINFRFATLPTFQQVPISFPQNDIAIGESLQVSGIPTPTVSIDSGTLPDGVSFLGGAGSAQFGCCNSSTGGSAPVGNYNVTLRATNAAGSVTQGVTVQVTDATVPVTIATISEPPNNSIHGQFQKWVYQAGGPGPYYFYTNMTFPTGIAFHDNGNGIATVSGADVSNGGPLFCPNTASGGCNIWVTNDTSKIGTFNYGDCSHDANCSIAMARFDDFTPRPDPATLAQSTVKFHAGQPGSYMLTASNNVANVSYSAPCGLPGWATLTDNKNGTATLSGTPPLESGAPVTSPDIIAVNPALIVVNTFSLPVPTYTCSTTPANLNIDVDYSPIFTSPSFTTGKVGQFLTLSLQSNVEGGTIILDSPLPPGLSLLDFRTGAGLISGIPFGGTGRDYTINYHVQYIPGNAFGSPIISEQAPPVVLRINEAPTLQLPALIFAMEGVNTNFPIAPTGFPNFGDMTLSHLLSLPQGLILHSASDISSANGAGAIQGVPAPGTAGKIYPLFIGAANSIGSASQQTVIVVVPAGDVNHDGKTDCSDVTAVKAALNAKRGAANFNYYADINSDGVVNVLDLAFITAHLSAGTVCH